MSFTYTHDPYAGQYPPPPPLPLGQQQQEIISVDNGQSSVDEEMDLKEYLYAERQQKLKQEQDAMLSSSQPPILFSQPPPLNYVIPPYPPVTNNYKKGYCFGVSFCACFWSLFLFVLFLAGIALIIIAKQYTKMTCNDNQSSLCGKVLYNGLLYGGIAVAGVSGLVVLWRIIHWLSRSKRN